MGNVVEEWLKFLEMNMMGLFRDSCMLGYLGIFCFCYVVGRLKCSGWDKNSKIVVDF